MVLYVTVGLLFLAAGIFMIRCPQMLFEITESWKNSAPVEPSGWYIRSVQTGGILVSLVGAAACMAALIL